LNDDRGISIYDQDWNFIKRKILTGYFYKSLKGNIFIYGEFIYIGNIYYSNYYDCWLLKLDFDLHIISYQYFSQAISPTFDSCKKRILLLRMMGGNSQINIDVYDVNLRKISEINCTSINSDIDTYGYWLTTASLGFFNNQLYISYLDKNSTQIILVTDINGQYITKHVLIQTSLYYWLNSFTFDHFRNILFTTGSQICLFSTILNNRKCIDITINDSFYFSLFDYKLYAKVDQSGRLVVIDSFEKKLKFYGPFET
jgi:hypothetical protein